MESFCIRQRCGPTPCNEQRYSTLEVGINSP